MKQNKTLLVITPHFLAFVHDQVIEMAKFYSKIYVIVVHPKILKFQPKKTKISNKIKIDTNNLPSNVRIFETSYLAIPGKPFQHLRGNSSYKKVVRIINRNNIKFDLIHSHFLWPAGFVGAKLKEKHNVPCIVTGHGYDVYDLPFRNNKWKTRISKILTHTDAIITVSRQNEKLLTRLTSKKIFVIPNGYNSTIFTVDPRNKKKMLALPDNKKIILSVGNLELVKGHEYLVSAVEKIIQKNQNIYCVIVGGGSRHSFLEKLIKQKGLEKFIRLIGAVQPEEVPNWMNACDVYIQPSIKESFGIVLLEALSCGKPVIGTAVGGIKEIINEKVGYLVPSGDENALSEAILKSLNHEWDKGYILDYVKFYTWENIISKTINIHNNMLILYNDNGS